MRFRSRHVHKTVADAIEAELTALGWVNSPVNFGTTPATFLEFQPDVAGVKILPNTIAITLGDEPPITDVELGDGIVSLDYPVFVDIYGEKRSISLSIASDVKDYLQDRYMTVLDYSGTTPATTTEYIEIDRDSVLMDTPAQVAASQDIRRNWIVVKAMVTVYFSPSASSGYGAGLYGLGGGYGS